MGTKKSRIKKLNDFEFSEYSKQTDLSPENIKNLHIHFKAISAMDKDDGVIDYNEFCTALKADHSLITDRIFKIFDLNSDSVLNFREFIMGISLLMNRNLESQIKITYSIFDSERKGTINKKEFLEILNSCNEKTPWIKFPPDVLIELVEKSFNEVNNDFTDENNPDENDCITYIQYKTMIVNNPNILKWFTIDFEKIKLGAELLMKSSKKYKKNFK